MKDTIIVNFYKSNKKLHIDNTTVLTQEGETARSKLIWEHTDDRRL